MWNVVEMLVYVLTFAYVCRYGLEAALAAEQCVTLVYGAHLADNRLMVLVAPPAIASLWCQGLQVNACS